MQEAGRGAGGGVTLGGLAGGEQLELGGDVVLRHQLGQVHLHHHHHHHHHHYHHYRDAPRHGAGPGAAVVGWRGRGGGDQGGGGHQLSLYLQPQVGSHTLLSTSTSFAIKSNTNQLEKLEAAKAA